MPDAIAATVGKLQAQLGVDRFTALIRMQIQLQDNAAKLTDDLDTLATNLAAQREVEDAINAELASWWPVRNREE